MEAKMILSVLTCTLIVHAIAAEAVGSTKKEAGQDLETAESGRIYNWNSGGGRYPQYPSNYPNYWQGGSGYQYTNPNYYNQYYPNTGYNYPNYNYPNFGYSNGFGYPGGYSNGYPGGYGGYPGFVNGYSAGSSRYNYDSRYRTNPDLQQTTARGGYIYRR